MGERSKKVDAYIARSAPFARPIMEHLRELVHKGCPEVSEDIKWGMPFFLHKGPLCNMAAFKQHCSFGFWKAGSLPDPLKLYEKDREAMGQLGQIKSLQDLPDDKILIQYIKQVAARNEQGIKPPAKKKAATPKELIIPDYLQQALKKNKKAAQTFNDFSYTNKKEYVDWLTEAKTDATREKRLETTLEWLAAGKVRNWKYVK